MKKVLIAEDEESVRDFIVLNLKAAGYDIVEAVDGADAIQKYEQNPDIDIAVLDIMMPKMDGLAVCNEIRQKNDRIGIIMLTAKTQDLDKVNALVTGADDYVTKPFSPSELVARVASLYRRVALDRVREENNFKDYIESGEFSLSLRTHNLSINGVEVELTQVEFQIMEYFMSNPGVALSRLDILNHVWGPTVEGSGSAAIGDDSMSVTQKEKIVDVNIRRLRLKIEKEPSKPKHILTAWGLGYRWEV